MSSRRRILAITFLSLLCGGAGFGYLFGRMEKWHQRGWAGVQFYPEVPRGGKAAPAAVAAPPGGVLMLYGGSPADRVFRPSDRIISVNGIPVSEVGKLRALDAALPGKANVTYRILRDGRTQDVTLQLASPLRSHYIVSKSVVAIVVALVFFGVGLLVFLRRPEDERAVVFHAFTLISGIAVLGGAATVYENAGGRGIVPVLGLGGAAPAFFFLLSIAYAPLILHLSLVFPRRRPALERYPQLIRWIYAAALLSALLFVLIAVLLLTTLADPSQPARMAFRLGRVLGHGTRGVAVVGLLLALHIIFLGRRQGIVRAFAVRPFRAVFALFAICVGLALLVGRYSPKPVAFAAGVGTVILPVLILGSFPVFAAVALVRSYRAAGVEEKRQVQWPLWGMLIALTVKIVTFAGALVGGVVLSSLHVSAIPYRALFQALDLTPTLTSLLIPISFAAAILKYRLMNIDVIIRKTVVYAILSGAIVIFYFGVVALLGTLLVSVAGLENNTLVIASTIIVALAFVPLRNKLQTLVDRNLFRHRYDYPDALRAIVTASRGASDSHEFLADAAEKVQQALQNRAIVIFVERQDEFVAAAKVGVSDTLLGRLRVPRAFGELLDRPFDPRRRALPGDASAALARVETALVVPAGHRAFIAAAPKLAGGELDVEDIDFLRSAADQIANAVDRIRMQVEEADFAQARAIQQTLLPREMPRIEGIDVSGTWQPARTMGGDYYDLLKLGEYELAVCIGDVAGKGMPAALLMSGLQAAVRASASSSPRDLCERVRRVVVSSLSGGRFVTFFYATIDTRSMTLRWCNAGHNAPVLARADGTIVRLEEGGPAFSRLFSSRSYEERELALEPGDRLVLFTDGVSEAMDTAGELFGDARIEELTVRAGDTAARELQERIVEAASRFSGGDFEDDVTLVVIRVHQAQPASAVASLG